MPAGMMGDRAVVISTRNNSLVSSSGSSKSAAIQPFFAPKTGLQDLNHKNFL